MLPLKGRIAAQLRAAHAALTRAQVNADKTIKYEIMIELPKWLAQREPPIIIKKDDLVSCSGGYNVRKGFRNFTHEVAIKIWKMNPDNTDIRTEDGKLIEWINSEAVIQTAVAGYQKARARRSEVIDMIHAGKTKEMEEGEIQALIKSISDTVAEAPPKPGSECSDKPGCSSCSKGG